MIDSSGNELQLVQLDLGKLIAFLRCGYMEYPAFHLSGDIHILWFIDLETFLLVVIKLQLDVPN